MTTRACLVKISPLDPATGTRVDIHVASLNDAVSARQVTGLDGKVWEPALKMAPLLTMNLWNGDFQAAVDPGLAIVPLKMETVKATYTDADGYYWIGAPVEIYAEAPGTAWPWTAKFAGRVDTLSRRGQDLILTAKVDEGVLQKSVLTATYAGTGDAEGGVDLKNKLKPLVIGWAKNVEPVLIDAVNDIWQFSAYGAIEEITTLYERGSAFSAAVADYPDFATLLALPPPAGRYSTCLALGMIRLGAPAYGVITADLKGHKVGSATPRLTGAVIEALAGIAGVSTGDIETASLAALDAAAPYPINLVVREQISWLDLSKRLALACNWQAGVSWAGKFFAAEVSLAGTEAITLDAQGQATPQVIQSDEQDVSLPYFKTVMGADRCWRVHTTDEIAFNAELIDRGAYDNAVTYREGMYVTSPDASQWLYVYPTPTSGNPPPTWPLTANTWWENMIPPVTGEPGEPGESVAPVMLYKRTATSSAPTKPSTTSTYTFATATLTGHDNGWAQEVPSSGGSYLWITTATARSADATDTIAAAEWSGPSLMAQDGAAGLSNAVVYLYQRSATTPAAPTGTFTYTFATGVLSGGTPGSWTQAIPAANGDPLWVIAATASSNTATDSIAAAEFSSPVIDSGAGVNTATVRLYQRASSAPAVPAATLTYTFATAGLSGTLGGWSLSVPSGSDPLYTTHAMAVSTSATDTIGTGEWATPTIVAQSGAAGLNNALVYLFRRSASAPTLPSTTSTYTFATGVLTGHNNSWTQTVPAANGQPLYVTVATASSNGTTDTIAAGEWASPTIMAQDGAIGSAGASNAIVRLYRRSATTPAGPSGTFTYTFATGVLSGGTLNGWTQAVPAADGNPLWVIGATASASGATDTIAAGEFTSPVIDSGAGVNQATVRLYQRSSSAPTVPASTLTYTFSSGALSGTLGSWSQTVPAANGQPLYTTQATALGTGATDTIATGEWSSPVVMAQDGSPGDPGAPGTSAATVFLFRRTASNVAPTLPSTTSTYTFATGVLTGHNNSWSQTVPSTGGSYLWATTATALGTDPTDSISSGEWASPNLIAQDGAAGNPGTAAISGYLSRESVSLFTYADGTVISFTNADGQFKLMQGETDVTGSATLSVTAAQCSGVINTSTGSPVAGQPKGYYRVTAMSADEATLTITATYNSVTVTKIFTITKVKAGYEIVASLPVSNLFEGRTVYLTTDDKLYRYTGSAWTKAVDGADISAGTVTTNALAAGSVTAAKISVTELSAITATIGVLRTATTGARVEYRDNVMKMYNGSNVLVLQMGDLTL